MKYFGYFSAYILFAFFGSIWSGYVLTVLWGWFAVIHGAPELTIAQAIGVYYVVSYITHQKQEEDKSKGATEKISEMVAYTIGKPVVFLLFGWIVTLFM